MLLLTSGHSNLTTGHVAAAHGRFSGIRQVAPMCTLTEYMLLWPTGVQIPNGISVGSAFLHSLRQSRYTLQQAAPFSLKIASSHGDLNPI